MAVKITYAAVKTKGEYLGKIINVRIRQRIARSFLYRAAAQFFFV